MGNDQLLSAYNVQIGVADEYIAVVDVNHHKDPFRAVNFPIGKDGIIRCPNGKAFHLQYHQHVSEAMNEIRFWYDGYRFGSTEIYNPWSVTNYFASGGQAKPYWANTSDNDIIREILTGLTPEIADDLAKVMQGEPIHTALDMEVVYPRMTDGNDTIFSFLLLAGYLTPSDRPEKTEIGTFASLRLPNAEIRRIYNTEILSWIRAQQSGNIISEIENAVYLSDAKRLQEALRKYMITSISFYDGAAEGFYHGMVLGLVASLSSKYYIRSNREAGDGAAGNDSRNQRNTA